MVFQVSKFRNCDSPELARFLNDIRSSNWSLSSSAFVPRPNILPLVTAEKLIKANDNECRVGLFILRHSGVVVSCSQIDKKNQKQDVIVFSNVETEPQYQKRGIFWKALGNTCLRQTCLSDCKRIELTTWSFNRKGIPLYKRVGFRAVPGTSLLMVNYLPSIVKLAAARPYFERYDYIRTLRNKRSYGYDAIEANGMSVFEYCWKPRKSTDTLRVLVDWQRKEIIDVECNVTETYHAGGEDQDV